MSVVAAVLAQTEASLPLPMPAWAFGALAFSIFTVLALIMWSYRDVANRHSHKAAPDAAAHAGAPGASHHGAGHPSESEH
jgi:hypothetical protein